MKGNTNSKKLNYDEVKALGKNQLNRQISFHQVNNLKREMVDSFDIFPPVLVNRRTMNIIDGQHRREAYLKLIEEGKLNKNTELKVEFVDIDEEDEKEKIIRANTNTKNWSVDDYIDSYTTEGREDYVRLKEWCLSHDLASHKNKPRYRYGAAIITGKNCSKDLKEGTFQVTEEQLDKASVVHVELTGILDTFKKPHTGAYIESLAIKWAEWRNEHSFEEWIAQLDKESKGKLAIKLENQSEWEAIFSSASGKIDKRNRKNV